MAEFGHFDISMISGKVAKAKRNITLLVRTNIEQWAVVMDIVLDSKISNLSGQNEFWIRQDATI